MDPQAAAQAAALAQQQAVAVQQAAAAAAAAAAADPNVAAQQAAAAAAAGQAGAVAQYATAAAAVQAQGQAVQYTAATTAQPLAGQQIAGTPQGKRAPLRHALSPPWIRPDTSCCPGSRSSPPGPFTCSLGLQRPTHALASMSGVGPTVLVVCTRCLRRSLSSTAEQHAAGVTFTVLSPPAASSGRYSPHPWHTHTTAPHVLRLRCVAPARGPPVYGSVMRAPC